jgi:integrase
MAKSNLPLVPPTKILRTVPPKRAKNAELRTREHMTPGEVETLLAAARENRHGHRDATMILLTYRHGLRAAEVCDLRWDQVDFSGAVLHVRRVKNGSPSTHPIQGDELRALRRRRPVQGWSSRPILTCCVTPAATPWPTRATTPGRSKDGSGIVRSPAPPSTRR